MKERDYIILNSFFATLLFYFLFVRSDFFFESSKNISNTKNFVDFLNKQREILIAAYRKTKRDIKKARSKGIRGAVSNIFAGASPLSAILETSGDLFGFKTPRERLFGL